MALCYNATSEEQSVKVFGNWYTFKPEQIRNLNDTVSHFIQTDRKESGLVILPTEFEDAEYKTSEDGKRALAEKRQEGIRHYLEFHRRIVYNNQVSLRQDLEKANIKADPAVFASAGEIKSMELLAKYKIKEADEQQQKVDRVKELMEQVKGNE